MATRRVAMMFESARRVRSRPARWLMTALTPLSYFGLLMAPGLLSQLPGVCCVVPLVSTQFGREAALGLAWLFLTLTSIHIVRVMRRARRDFGVLLIDQGVGLVGCVLGYGVSLLMFALSDAYFTTP
ncbi:MAG: hypothetical protein IT437_05600 [Phycisphaerales bacterium]|nr:hypothetical protein [Phycisphaerales bacterium]